jgi:unsaturated chondroitin disaccharide hydrolase
VIQIDPQLQPASLLPALERLWSLAAEKIRAIHDSAERIGGTPVFTVAGQYVAQGWTEWTQGFQYGCQLLQYDATGDAEFLELGRRNTLERMAHHITHIGVHDHGFNQVSTYGALRRLMLEGRIARDEHELGTCELALRASGAVQAARWSTTADGDGYIYSFNGPHSLFCDTIRSLRSLALAHQLGHVLWAENDRRFSLLERLVQHARATARYNVYYGERRDVYDVRGRVAHESLFNRNDGCYRCPSTQQGYSPFTTWTRGLAWIVLGYPEQLEWLRTVPDAAFEPLGGRGLVEAMMRRAAAAACDFYLEHTPTCGVPYWDTGAPGLRELDRPLERPADPQNDWEPVDSSAAAIAAQGLLRLGHYLRETSAADAPERAAADRYWQAGLTVLRTLLTPTYLCDLPGHQGLLQHAVYHRPRGWDHVPAGSRIPRGESCLWGDYHLMELALYVQRIARAQPYLAFFGPLQ